CTAAIALCELAMLKAATPADYAAAQRWMNLPVALLLVALAGFAHHYLDARLRWLAVTAIALRLVSLVINFSVGESGNFLRATSLGTPSWRARNCGSCSALPSRSASAARTSCSGSMSTTAPPFATA